MREITLYPELRDYIFQYCGKYFWNKQKTRTQYSSLVNAEDANIAMYKILTQGGDILEDKATGNLADDGYEAYKRRISEIIFKDHWHELELNLCPQCGKIARTPLAKQCRFCFHDWH